MHVIKYEPRIWGNVSGVFHIAFAPVVILFADRMGMSEDFGKYKYAAYGFMAICAAFGAYGGFRKALKRTGWFKNTITSSGIEMESNDGKLYIPSSDIIDINITCVNEQEAREKEDGFMYSAKLNTKSGACHVFPMNQHDFGSHKKLMEYCRQCGYAVNEKIRN